jgi:hypothetical protein
MTEKPSGRAQVLRIKADGFDELSVTILHPRPSTLNHLFPELNPLPNLSFPLSLLFPALHFTRSVPWK